MKNKTPKQIKQSECGNAALVAMVILGTIALTTLTLLASSTFRNTRNLDKGFLKVTEKWEARSQVNMLAAVISKDAPAQLETDVRFARETCNADLNLPIFDSDSLIESPISSPAVIFDGATAQCVGAALPATSIFGKFDNWRDARLPVFKQTGINRFNLSIDKVNIIEMTEIYRRRVRSGTSSDTAYVARFIVEAQFGNYRTRTSGEIILGSSIPGCGTTVSMEIVPGTVVRGTPVEMNISYTYANSLKISDASGAVIREEAVTEQSSSQTFVFRFTPAVSGSYRVTANGSGSCSAESAGVVVTVTDPPPVCPRIVNFSASSNTINSGESVTISWNVADAYDVRLEDIPVAAIGSQVFMPAATRTFTLTARDAANACPVSQTIQVIVRTPSFCNLSAPEIQRFRANRTSIAPGATVRLDWNIQRLDNTGRVKIVHPNGSETTGLGRNDRLDVIPPNASGNYTYTLVAANVCPNGGQTLAQATVIITVSSCPPPVVDGFSVNPSTVSAGGNQILTFSWAISGTADAVSISGGVGSGFPANGSVDVPQPQTTTTYTITANGSCGTRQAQVTITVSTCAIPVINSFTANPATVLAGGNQNILFSWNTTGDITSQSIDQAIGAVNGLNHSIGQPQVSTTYNYTVTGCGVSSSAPAVVTVATSPLFCPSGGNPRSYYQVRGTGGDGAQNSGEVVVIAQANYLVATQMMEITVSIENFFYGPNGNNSNGNNYVIKFGQIEIQSVINTTQAFGNSVNIINRANGQTYNFPLTYSSTPLGNNVSRPVLTGFFEVPYSNFSLLNDRLIINSLTGANATAYSSIIGWNRGAYNISIGGPNSSGFSCP
ncbi:MAG: hypothetical protein LH472_04820 [Pyrinomonadaceae bacterium]|nr:hypothetical protein [Pyrinomonadaceae bacterium]